MLYGGSVMTWTQRMHFAYHGYYQWQRSAASPCQCCCILGLEFPDYCSSDQRQVTDGAPGVEKQ